MICTSGTTRCRRPLAICMFSLHGCCNIQYKSFIVQPGLLHCLRAFCPNRACCAFRLHVVVLREKVEGKIVPALLDIFTLSQKSRNNRKGGTASLRSHTCVKHNVAPVHVLRVFLCIFCYTGVDQITTKGAGGSTHCQDNMLPRRECFLRIERALHRFCHKPSEGLSRSVVLSHHSRAQGATLTCQCVSSWMNVHDTPPRGTVLGCRERRKEKDSCFYAIREVRKRTLINDLLHGKGNCCVPSGHARH